jgi:4-amino-4-deoxy-L-arabinose transferase-like glycosyltransferase
VSRGPDESCRRAAARLGARPWPELALLLLCVPLLFVGLGSYSLVNGDEAVYHAVAERMVHSGDWLHLDFRGEHRVYDTFMNAPLQYWARALLIQVFGSNLWTARILSALFGAACVLLVFRLAERLADRLAAFLAGLVLLTTFQFVFLHSARTGELETAVSFLIALAALLFLRSMEREGSFLGHHLAVAALVNVKLPLAILPFTATLLAFATLPATRPHFARWLRTGLAVLPFAVAWPAFHLLWWGPEALGVARTMAGQAGGAFTPDDAASGASNLVYYAKVLLFGGYPWILLAPFALGGVLWRSRRTPAATAWCLLALSALVVCGFYALVSKRGPWYLIPVYPLLSVFVGKWLADLLRSAGRDPAQGRGPGGLELAGLACAAAGLLWSRVPTTGYNPFSMTAISIPMETAWRGPGAPPAAFAAVATAVLMWVGLAALRRRSGRGALRGAAAVVVAALLAVAGARVLVPLAYLGYQSPLALAHRALAYQRATGVPVRFPVDLPPASLLLVRYYFADAYRIGAAAPGPGRAPGSGVFRLVGERGAGAREAP